MSTERTFRTILADSIDRNVRPEPPLEHNGSSEFLRSSEPLNDFYVAIIEAMRDAQSLVTN